MSLKIWRRISVLGAVLRRPSMVSGAWNVEQSLEMLFIMCNIILTMNNYLCLQVYITVLLPLRQVEINTAGSRIQIDHPEMADV